MSNHKVKAHFFVALISLAVSAVSAAAQGSGGLIPIPPTEKPGTKSTTPKTKGKQAEFTEEGVQVNGAPAMKFTADRGWHIEIFYVSKNGEDGFVFPVYRVRAMSPTYGTLYITRTRIAFVPEGSKEQGFNVSHDEVVKTGKGSFSLAGKSFKVDFGNKTFNFVFDYKPGEHSVWYKPPSQSQAIEFCTKAFFHFDEAVAEFQKVTAGGR